MKNLIVKAISKNINKVKTLLKEGCSINAAQAAEVVNIVESDKLNGPLIELGNIIKENADTIVAVGQLLQQFGRFAKNNDLTPVMNGIAEDSKTIIVPLYSAIEEMFNSIADNIKLGKSSTAEAVADIIVNSPVQSTKLYGAFMDVKAAHKAADEARTAKYNARQSEISKSRCIEQLKNAGCPEADIEKYLTAPKEGDIWWSYSIDRFVMDRDAAIKAQAQPTTERATVSFSTEETEELLTETAYEKFSREEAEELLKELNKLQGTISQQQQEG